MKAVLLKTTFLLVFMLLNPNDGNSNVDIPPAVLTINAGLHANINAHGAFNWTAVSDGYLVTISLRQRELFRMGNVTFTHTDTQMVHCLTYYYNFDSMFVDFKAANAYKSILIDDFSSITLSESHVELKMNVDGSDPHVYCEVRRRNNVRQTFNASRTGGIGMIKQGYKEKNVSTIVYNAEKHGITIWREKNTYELQVDDDYVIQRGDIEFVLDDSYSTDNDTSIGPEIWRSPNGKDEIRFDANGTYIRYRNYNVAIEPNSTVIRTKHIRGVWAVEDDEDFFGTHCRGYEALAMRPPWSDRWEAQIVGDQSALKLENGKAYYSDKNGISFQFRMVDDVFELFLSNTSLFGNQ